MSDSDHEMRRFPRIETRHAVLVKKLDGDLAENLAPTRTIALGGCSLVTDEPLGIGSDVELMIAVDQNVVSARGRVVYVVPAGDGRTENGIAFSHLDESAERAIRRLFTKEPE